MDSKEKYLKSFEEFEEKQNQEPIELKESEFVDLKELINGLTYSTVEIYDSIRDREMRLVSDGNRCELSLRSEFIPLQTLVIKNIVFTPKQKGIGSKVLSWLINYSVSKGFDRIVLENVNTDEGLNFAKSKGFTKCYNPSSEFFPILNDELMGDYQLEL
ncbi:GNAT family N-acetyltransferase [Aquisalibacillus elongatus]|uniref:N-acetyltransferase domain-containing protein n=1 Tax=Aquisalibacillus elongatus TaxID=485577 RepID=A0A3N5CB10_9BACI|nr:GNAT family N-acetyltransferase [Aquisalibacillus elongatus]RPF57032.1 hypothetical protein EDC24_0080 [Aquisalibacillus elongatus]